MYDESLLAINVKYCRVRQKKLLEIMQRQRLDLVIFTKHENVQWLVGPRFNWYHEPAAAIWSDGRVTLVAPNKSPDEAAADDIHTYEANSTSTLRNDQRQKSSAVLVDAIFAKRKPQRVGVEFSCCSQHITGPL
jgi:Xaa-Pro aminopeptidase